MAATAVRVKGRPRRQSSSARLQNVPLSCGTDWGQDSLTMLTDSRGGRLKITASFINRPSVKAASSVSLALLAKVGKIQINT